MVPEKTELNAKSLAALKLKAGVVRDINVSKSGFTTITVVQSSGERFKTLAGNVVIS